MDDEFASLNATIDLLLDIVEARLPERSLQASRTIDSLLHNRFAFQIAIAREGDGPPCGIGLLTVVLVMRAPVLDGFNDLHRLVPKALGDVLVPLLHLFMRHVELAVARLVRRDLCRRGAVSTRFGQVVLNLLTARTGRIKVLARVAADLRLAAATTLDLVAQGGQPRRMSWTHRTARPSKKLEERLCGEMDCSGLKSPATVDQPQPTSA
jgi:hypothetical protein